MNSTRTWWQVVVVVVVLFEAVQLHAQADPARIQPMSVTASGTYGKYRPSLAIDGNSGTYWNSGGHAPQWIQLDLGRPVSVRTIRVQYGQHPVGQEQGNIILSTDGTTWTTASSCYWNQSISDRQWVQFTTDQDAVNPPRSHYWYCHYNSPNVHGGNVRYIRITTTSSPSRVAIREIEVYGGLQYFGYFRDAGHFGNYTAETKNAGANLTWISIPNNKNTTDLSTMMANLTARLTDAETNGVEAVIDLDPDYLCLWADQTTLVDAPSLTTCWTAIKNEIINGAHQNRVAAFYLNDEPYLELAPTGDYATQRSNLTTLRNMVKADFPNAAIAAIIYVGEIGDDAPYPLTRTELAMFDWVGFDDYLDGYSLLDHYADKLRALLVSTQRMIAVPAAGVGWSSFPDANPTTIQREIDTNNQYWMSEILSDAQYVALVPFMWTQGQDTGFTGARDIPWLSAREFEIASSFLNLTGGDTHVFPLSWSVSGTDGDFQPFGMLDRNTSTYWNSGAFPDPVDQWVDAVLLGPTRVTKIQLTVHQSPFGDTWNRIMAKRANGTWFVLRDFHGTTTDGQVLTHNLSPAEDLLEIKVLTLQGPSWVAWREVEIFR